MLDPIYFDSLEDQFTQLLTFTIKSYKDIDVEWVLVSYLNSRIRDLAEEGNPRSVCLGGARIMEYLKTTVNEIPRSTEFNVERDNDVLYWIALVYNGLFFYYGIKGKDAIEQLSIHDLFNRYYPCHEMSIRTMCESLVNEGIVNKTE